jgi:hypothetical protein
MSKGLVPFVLNLRLPGAVLPLTDPGVLLCILFPRFDQVRNRCSSCSVAVACVAFAGLCADRHRGPSSVCLRVLTQVRASLYIARLSVSQWQPYAQ